MKISFYSPLSPSHSVCRLGRYGGYNTLSVCRRRNRRSYELIRADPKYTSWDQINWLNRPRIL